MAGIFISYRRDDAQGEALHLFDNLKQHFGADRVFMDVIAIRPGEDYRKVIDSAVASCDVLITLIGREWLTSTTTAGQARINDARDFVRLETAAALKRDVRVIPVLVHGATMPTEEVLPDELKPLAYRNAIEVSHSRWDYDVRMLIEALERVMTPASAVATPTPATPAATTTRRPIRSLAAAGAAAVLLLGGGAYWYGPRLMASKSPVSVTTTTSSKEGSTSTTAGSSKEGSKPASTKPDDPPKVKLPPPPTPKLVPVPRLTELKEAEAIAAIEGAGLKLGKRSTVKTNDVAPGTVLSQTPSAGESVEKGRGVALDVAVADLRTMPNLIGMTLGEATGALTNEGLKWASGPLTTDDVKRGTVGRQRPAAGTELKPDTMVEFLIAVPATIVVPQLVGMARRDAEGMLKKMALGYKVYERPSREPPNTVVGVDPPAGTRVKSDHVIDLQVAAADLRTVPDVVSTSIGAASDLVRKAGLKPIGVEQSTSIYKPGVVVRQEPAAGARVSPGTEITLTFVALPIEVPNVTRVSTAEARDRLAKVNLNWKEETAPSQHYKPGIVMGQQPEPGARVAPKSTITLIVAVSADASTPGTCIPGYIWRDAFVGDHVCVALAIRNQALSDNSDASRRLERDPSKRVAGPDTCAQGYVWREARPTDHVCVTPETRARVAEDNKQAASRIAR